jgi:hypothetical protein
MMALVRTLQQLASDLVARALPTLDQEQRRSLAGDLAAGDFEVTVISALEIAPGIATRRDLDELATMAVGFDALNRGLADSVVARLRHDPDPTFADLPAGMIRTPRDTELWAETSPKMRRWIVREAQSILDDYGPQTLHSIGGILVAGG